LGERIVEEFGLSDSVDTLGRWMAHRVAELMDRAERVPAGAEREAARRECSDLIIKLWGQRSHWPHGRPLAGVAGLVKNLINDQTNYGSRYQQYEVKIDVHSWIGILPSLRHLQYREDEVCRSAAIADFDLEADRKWLTEHGPDLSDEEREIMSGLISERERMDEPYFELDKTRVPNFASLTSVERARLVHDALKKINEERLNLLASVQLKDERPEKRRNAESSVSPARRTGGKARQRSPQARKKSAPKKGVAKKVGGKKHAAKKATRR
jgi:hypothetical protein